MSILVVAIVIVILFGAAFVAKRRFGLLGLALASGSILSTIWEREAGLLAGMLGIAASPLSAAAMLAIITLLPSAILLFHGYTYKSLFGRVIGSILFTILAMAFLIEPISRIIVVQGFGSDFYNWIYNSRAVIIGVGLPLAIVDLFLTKPAVIAERRSKH